MKKLLTLLLTLLLLSALCLPAAADGGEAFRFALSANGKSVAEVESGDTVTVSLMLERIDSDAPFTVYGMQDELRYDSSFLQPVEGSLLTAPGVVTTDISVQGTFRELYMNYVSLGSGEVWAAHTPVGSVQFRVIGTEGISRITNMDARMSAADGLSPLPGTVQDVSVVIAGDCLVRFETFGGTEYSDRVVRCGQYLSRPADPVRKGYTFMGWYADDAFTELWDFENDMVAGDMTLRALWQAEDAVHPSGTGLRWLPLFLLLLPLLLLLLLLLFHTVHFDTDGVCKVKDRYVFIGRTVAPPVLPEVPGRTPDGWYRDREYSELWDFEHNRIRKKTTIYAKWK